MILVTSLLLLAQLPKYVLPIKILAVPPSFSLSAPSKKQHSSSQQFLREAERLKSRPMGVTAANPNGRNLAHHQRLARRAALATEVGLGLWLLGLAGHYITLPR